jgi:AraC-like DNA-binding protein
MTPRMATCEQRGVCGRPPRGTTCIHEDFPLQRRARTLSQVPFEGRRSECAVCESILARIGENARMSLRVVDAIVRPVSGGNVTPVIQPELNEILRLALSLAKNNGTSATAIPFLSVIKSAKATPLTHGVLTPSFCLVAQGGKKVHIGSEVVRYGKGSYLASIIDMPSAGQVLTATQSTPYIGIKIDLTTEEIASVVLDAKLRLKSTDRLKPGAFVGSANRDLLELFVKLLKLLNNTGDAAFLAPGVKREIIYRLLTAENGDLFFQHTIIDHQTIGIGKAIKWIKDNFNRPFSIDQLAKASNMSTSSLHHKFKTVTTMGPLQYQKQLRLQEARRLLMAGSFDATTAAMQVGYQSPSQFNREYRRLFGLPPLKDMKSMRDGASYQQ